MTTKLKNPPKARQERLPLPRTKDDEKAAADGVADLVHAIAGPVIVFPNTGWEESIPKWCFNEIQLRRLMQAMKQHQNAIPPEEKDRALNIEAMVYIYPASLAAPLDHDWTNIYCWLAKTCMMERMAGGKKMKAEDFAAFAPKELSDHEKRELDGLKRWLWEKNLEQKQELRKRARERERVVQIPPPEGQMYFSFWKDIPAPAKQV